MNILMICCITMYIYKLPVNEDFLLKKLILDGVNGICIRPYIIIDRELLEIFDKNSLYNRPVKLFCYGRINITDDTRRKFNPPYAEEVNFQFGNLGTIIGYGEIIIEELKKQKLLC